MQRRDFIRLCAATAAGGAAPALAIAGAAPQFYARARLVDERGEPLRATRIPPQRNLIFHYPYATTPCFLLNLGRSAAKAARLRTADRRDYEWPGGVGPGRSVVAYSAICAHQLTYPTREISFISYRSGKSARNPHANVIHCCSEHSQYDPADGARVVAGPAPQPLAAILLEHDARTDGLFAVGTLGGEMFNQFFSKFEFRLALENSGAARRAVADRATVVPLENYCRQQVRC
ncbi:MAG: (2Fe-2S)-binding protein [Betaproteobacteria bacterium]|nr:MAG: (2Fe-2S)-binding protein [Betaproteobacteria bacterium]